MYVLSTLTIYVYILLQEKVYGLEELQDMFMEMAEGFESPSMYCGTPSMVDESFAKRGSVLTR